MSATTRAAAGFPIASEEQKRWYDKLQQASSSGETAALLWESRNRTDVSDTARRVTQPALVVDARHGAVIPYVEAATRRPVLGGTPKRRDRRRSSMRA